VLAAVGIFGVVSYSTAQRAGELGMRMALGARQSAVLWLVLKQGVGLTIVGAVVGLAGGLGLGRVLSSMMPNLPAPEFVMPGAFAFGGWALAAFFIQPGGHRRPTDVVLRHE
jgi:ABC-type antimicrobial peptide transport system permease subunit